MLCRISASLFPARTRAWFAPTLAAVCLLAALGLACATPAWAATASNAGAIVGDWLGTADDDDYTNESTGSISGDANMAQGGSDEFTNAGSINGSIFMSSDGHNTVTNSGTVNAAIYGNANTDAGASSGHNTITNSGTADSLLGSLNTGAGSSGGQNTIYNYGTVHSDIIGSDNFGENTSGGQNIIFNYDSAANVFGSSNTGANTSGGDNVIFNADAASVSGDIIGSENTGGNASGGDNTIVNSGTVSQYIIGSNNTGAGSSGGDNTIYNYGSAMSLHGSSNAGENSQGGENTIYNYGSTGSISGSYSSGIGASGGSNIIYNYGSVSYEVFGSRNTGDNSSGGENTIYNYGTIGQYLHASQNYWDNSSGGENLVYNYGTITSNFYGCWNRGAGSSGGGNILYNYGSVGGNLIGSYNRGAGSSGGGNYIYNHGAVTGDIYGSRDYGAGSSSTGNFIYNYGSVGGSIYAGNGDDTVYIDGGTVGGVVDGQDGDDSLILLNLAGVVSSGKYINFENFGMSTSRDLTLAGNWSFNLGMSINGGRTTISDNVFASLATVNGGVLDVAGTLSTGLLHIGGNGYLVGSGRINGNVVNGGYISPGNSIGALHIDGDLTMTADSVLLAELAADGGSDVINVSGALTMQGGQVAAYLERGLYVDGFAWTLINAGSVSGQMAGLNLLTPSNVIGLTAQTTSDGLLATVNRTPYASFGVTANQRAVGAALDSIVPLAASRGDAMAALLTSVDFDYDQQQISGLLAAANPEMYDGLSWAALAGARRFDAAMQNRADWGRVAQRLGAPLEATTQQHAGCQWSLWTRAVGGWDRRSAENGYLGYQADSGGVVLGADGQPLPWLRLGLAFGGDETRVNFSQQGDNGDQKSMRGGLYAAADLGEFYLNGAVSYATFDNDANRSVIFAGQGATAQSSYGGQAWLASLGGGWDQKLAAWLLGPMARLDYLSLSEESFSERNAGLMSLNVGDRNVDYWSSALGLRAASRYNLDGWALLPRVELAWRHLFKDDRREVSASFPGYGGNSFTVHGLEQAQDSLEM